jgi:hypothetical protein
MSTREEVLACQFGSWFAPYFAPHSMKSRVITLPDDFIAYLTSDGIHIPTHAQPSIKDEDVFSDDEDLKSISSEESTPQSQIGAFSALQLAVEEAMEPLGGEVFVKLNWSAPLDASWMNGGTMKCVSFNEILLLLKSSDRIIFDLEHMFNACDDGGVDQGGATRPDVVTLVVRKWANLHPSMEFRLFVVENNLVGIHKLFIYTYKNIFTPTSTYS